MITWATDDSKSSGSAPFSLAIFFRAGIILAQEVDQEIICKRMPHVRPAAVLSDAPSLCTWAKAEAVNEESTPSTIATATVRLDMQVASHQYQS